MEFWNTILNTALLGTEKTELPPDGLGPDLAPLAAQINSLVSDKEDRFLRTAALAFSYRQAGAISTSDANVHLLPAPQESKPYCSTQAQQILTEILARKQYPLLTRWLQLCRSKDQLITPDLLPALLETGAEVERFRENILACGGERGRWLTTFNPDWSTFTTPALPDEEIWLTGGQDQRANILFKVSAKDPNKAREWLTATWPKEDANTRTNLLSSYHAGPEDLPFLESLITDKSKKVRDTVFIKLQTIPSSNLVQQYREALKTRLILKKEKALLGLSSKFVLAIQPAAEELPALVVQSGIEKLSKDKTLSDDVYICRQLIRHIPLDFYMSAWGKTKEELISIFVEDRLGKTLLSDLLHAIVRSHDHEAAALLKKQGIVDAALTPLLPEKDQDAYIANLFSSDPEAAMVYAQGSQKEWGPQTTEQALRFACRDQYRYSKSWCEMYISVIPVDAAALLPNIQPPPDLPGAVAAWPSIRESLLSLLQLKTNTINAFK